MECQHCRTMTLSDWSHNGTEHSYCRTCGAHYHNGTWYTKEEWFFFINEQMHMLKEDDHGQVRENNT